MIWSNYVMSIHLHSVQIMNIEYVIFRHNSNKIITIKIVYSQFFTDL